MEQIGSKRNTEYGLTCGHPPFPPLSSAWKGRRQSIPGTGAGSLYPRSQNMGHTNWYRDSLMRFYDHWLFRQTASLLALGPIMGNQ